MKFCKFFFCIAFSFTLVFFAFDAKAQINQPSRSNSSETAVRNWDYCVIYRTSNGQTKDKKITGIATISYLDETGERDEYVEIEMPESSKDYMLATRKAIGKAFTKLGNDGWEFVGRFPYAPVYSNEPELGFIFKRPKK